MHVNRPLLYVASEDQAFVAHRLPMARAAQAAGFDVHVATGVMNHGEAIARAGFTVHAVPFHRGSLSPLSSLRTIWTLRRLHRRLRPAIIHHSGLQACILGGIAARGTPARQVNALTGLGYTFTSQNASGLRTLLAPILRSILMHPNSTPLVQNPDDGEALAALGVEPARIVTIPGSGVDTDTLKPMQEPEGPITIGFAGRLLTDKGIRALVEAHRIMRRSGRDIRLVIAGEPDPANPASVTVDEVRGWTREPGITCLGQIKDIQALWQRAHIAALPSHREGLPKSLLEAAACGRPIVATDAPGCREIAVEGVTGFRVPVEDAASLAAAITRLADDPALRAQFGAAARRLTEERFSASIIGTRIAELYRGLLAPLS